MRRHPFVFVAGCGLLVIVAGCADLYRLDDYSTRDARQGEDSPDLVGAGAPSTATNGDVAGGLKPACTTNADCAARNAGDICVKAVGRCAALATPECPRVHGDAKNDAAVIVGTLLDSELERAASLALSELNAREAGGGLPAPASATTSGPRPLVILGCEPSLNVIRAARHLAHDLHVPAIIGPQLGEEVVEVTEQVSAEAGTLVVTPTAVASPIASLADDDLTWRVIPSDAQRVALVAEQTGELEEILRATRGLTAVRFAVAHRNDALGQSARDAIMGKVIVNGRFINDSANARNVSVDGYAGPDDASALEGIVSRYAGTFRPDLVYVTAPEQIDGLIVPLERALTAARAVYRPYYLITEAAKTDALLAALGLADMPSDLRRRIRGVASTFDTASASIHEGFRSRYAAAFEGASPSSMSAAATYDATYAVAYAIAATPGATPSGANVARGLRRLATGTAASVGPAEAAATMKLLGGGKSVALRGANTLLKWDARGDIAAGTVEVWCIGAATGAPAFGSSGMKMDVETQVVGGSFVQCQ